MADYSLVLVHSEHLQARSDFERIRDRINERAPDIEVFIVPNQHLSPVTRKAAARHPSLVFSPPAIQGFRPARGRIYQGTPISKSQQMAALVAAGIPTPPAVEVTPGTTLDPESWGPFTVMKPENAKQGEGVRLVRTQHVRWVDPRSWPRDDPCHGQRMIAQRFIDTGSHPTSYRVMTVFGRPTYSLSSTADNPRPELDPNGTDELDLPIASNAGKRSLAYNFAPDILALGSSVYPAFPQSAVHGVDVIREAGTGKLYVLEFNPAGFTWHFSSTYFEHVRKEYGFDLHGQFHALDTIADALIEKTRAEAI